MDKLLIFNFRRPALPAVLRGACNRLRYRGRRRKTFGLVLFAAMAALMSAPSARCQETNAIILTNKSRLPLTGKAISIARITLPEQNGAMQYPLLLAAGGDTIPTQLDDRDGDGSWDELFFVADLRARAKEKYRFAWIAAPPMYEKRTSVRFGKRKAANEKVQPAVSDTLLANGLPKRLGYQPYQTDGPSWENDKVGFRHYLDGRNAKDVFGKRTASMSPEQVGLSATGAVEDNYHVMEEWGRDILAVGNSAGLGGIALLRGDSLMRLGVTVNDSVHNIGTTVFRIASEGPVRSILHFRYHNWQPGDRNYTVEEFTSIWPGMYAYQNEVRVSGLQGNEHLGIGLVNINTTNPVQEIRANRQWVVLMTHDRQTYNKEWWLGMALMVPADAYLGYTRAPDTGTLSQTFLARMKIGAAPVRYFAVAGWELSDDGFKNKDYFERYVRNLADQLAAKVVVRVKRNRDY